MHLIRLGLTILTLVGAAWAQPDAGVAPPAEGGEETAEAAPPADPMAVVNPRIALSSSAERLRQLETIWRLRMDKLKDKEEERAADLLERVLTLRKDAGAARLDSHAIQLAVEARAAAKVSDYDRAERRLEAAHKMAPGLPDIHDESARLALDRQRFAVHKWAGFKIKALQARLGDFQRRMLLLSDAVLTTLIILSVLAVFFFVAQLARYGLNLFHDLGDVFPSFLRGVLILAGLVLVALPIFYGFGPLLYVFPVALLVWSYQRWSEKLITLGFVVLVAGTPWLLRVGDRLTEAGTGTSGAMYKLSLDPTDRQALEQVDRGLAEDPEDWQARAVLGVAYKRAGRLDEARALLEVAAKQADPEAQAAVLNNLGNVHFAAGRAAAAEDAYTRAVKADPQAAEPVFNLHRLALRSGDKAQAESFGDKAAALGAARVAAWTEDDDPGVNRYVADMALPEATWNKRALADILAPTPFSARLWVVSAGPLPEMTAPITGAATLLMLFVLSASRRRMRVQWPCERCGDPATVWLADGFPSKPTCDTCDSMFVRNVPVDRALRFAKEESIARYKTIVRGCIRFAGVLLPGLGRLVVGQALRGVILLAVTFLIAARLLWPDGLLLEPFSLPLGAASGISWTLVVVLGLVWLISAAQAWRLAGERT